MKRLFGLIRKVENENGVIAVGGKPLPYTVERSTRRKRTIAFAMTAETTLRVMAPQRMRLSTIEAILRQNTNGAIYDLLERHRATPGNTTLFTHGSTLSYLGHNYILEITQNTDQPPQCRLYPRRIMINIPHENLSATSLRDEAKTEFTLWLKKRAKVKFKKRMDLWAVRMGVTYKRMIVSNPEQRWGSCSVDNIIRLNWRLMMAPLPILDYVVAHELAHCVHKDHSIRFWRFLIAAIPESRERRHQLHQMSSHLNF